MSRLVAALAALQGAASISIPAGVELESVGIELNVVELHGSFVNGCNCTGQVDDCRALVDLYNQNPDHPAYRTWCHAESADPCAWSDDDAANVYIHCTPAGLQAPMRRVTALRVRNQAITGTMPESLGVISELVKLDLSGNALRGAVPASLALLSKLRELELESNSLSSLPSSLCATLSDDSLDCDLAKNAFEHSPSCATRCNLGRQGLGFILPVLLAASLLFLCGLVIYCIRIRMKKTALRQVSQEIASARPSMDSSAQQNADSLFSEAPTKRGWANSTVTLMSVTNPLAASGHQDKPPSPRQEWFSRLFGFSEGSYAETQRWLRLSPDGLGDGTILESVVNGMAYKVGFFDTPTLRELREKGPAVRLDGRLTLAYTVGDSSEMHALPENKFATFQVESQFNCLEFAGPNMAPEDGVTGYMNDRSQGCACSVACGPATVYRNHFVPVSGDPGQTRECMINNLADVSEVIGNVPEGKFFRVLGGYVVASEAQFRELAARLQELDAAGRSDAVRSAIRVGVQQDVQVTATSWGSRPVVDPTQAVTQVFCGFARAQGCEAFASMVLEASYEAALWAGLLAASRHQGAHGSRRVFLSTFSSTCSVSLAAAALERACERFGAHGLEIVVVGPGPEPLLVELARRVS